MIGYRMPMKLYLPRTHVWSEVLYITISGDLHMTRGDLNIEIVHVVCRNIRLELPERIYACQILFATSRVRRSALSRKETS